MPMNQPTRYQNHHIQTHLFLYKPTVPPKPQETATMTSGVEPRPKGMRLVVRDFDILLSLHTARYLTTQQIERLFWRESKGGVWGRTKAYQQRLRRLLDYGLVRRIQRPVKRGERTLPTSMPWTVRGLTCLWPRWASNRQRWIGDPKPTRSITPSWNTC